MANVIELIRSRTAAGFPRLPGGAWLAALALGWFAGVALFGDPDMARWMLEELPALLLPVAALAVLCLLPGLALLRWLWGTAPLMWPERLALAGGLGIGMPALALMGFHLLQIPWPSWATYVYLGVAALGMVIPRRMAAARPAAATPLWASLTLGGLTLAALLTRLYTGRDLIVGANVDSYHHTLITQLLVERSGLYTNWEPYAPLATFTYHYGFHACLAFVHWLTGLPVAGLLPVVGQALGAAIVPALYALTTRLTGSIAAGIWAALLAGFVNTQPAFYVFWGRYPFIASHLLLIAALLCWMSALEAPRLERGPIALAALACTALAHTHYQTTILAALFIGAYLSALLLRAPDRRSAGALLGRAALIGGVALVLAGPWLFNTLSGELDRNVAYTSDRQSGAVFAGVPLPALTPFYVKGPLIMVALAGILAALRRHDWRAALPGVWALLTVLVVLPYLFGLPGTGMIEPSVGPLALYLSVMPLAGYPLGLLTEWLAGLRARIGAWVGPVVMISCAFVTIWSVAWQRDLAPGYVRMVTPADARAITWIRSNTPADARFLINSNPLYGGLMLVGTDAGYWLPLLAGRTVNVPPLTYGSERSIDPQFVMRTHALAEALRAAPLSDGAPRLIDLARDGALRELRAGGIRYVYLGAQPLIGAQTFAAIDRIDPAALRASPDYRLVYDDGGVLIFELIGGP